MFLHVELTIHFLWLTGGLVLLYFGAEWLVKGASQVALKLGVSPLVVGLTVVAFGTSMPELLVCLKANSPEILAAPAAWFGFSVEASQAAVASPDIAFGNIVGSNIFNIALILGVAAMIRPIEVHSQLIRRELPILLVASVAFAVMMIDKQLSRWEGIVLAAGIVIYVVTSIRQSKDKEDLGEFSNGEHIAVAFGVPEVIISLTLFALGTSLPELATSIVASLKKQGDLVTGNAIGSCIFNILAVMGVTAGVKPLLGGAISWLDIGVMLGLTILILPMMWSKMRLNRVEGTILTVVALSYSVMVIVVQR